jgi:hypothetical protein
VEGAHTTAPLTKNYLNKINYMNFKNTQKGDSELGFILVVLLIIFLIWLAMGGQNRPESRGGKYIVPLTDQNNPGATYN